MVKTAKRRTLPGKPAGRGKSAARKRVNLNPIERSLVEQSVQGALETELAAFDTILKGPPVLQAGSARTESRGAHPRPYDCPDHDDENFVKHSITRWVGDGPELSYREVRMTQWEPMERKY